MRCIRSCINPFSSNHQWYIKGNFSTTEIIWQSLFPFSYKRYEKWVFKIPEKTETSNVFVGISIIYFIYIFMTWIIWRRYTHKQDNFESAWINCELIHNWHLGMICHTHQFIWQAHVSENNIHLPENGGALIFTLSN